MIQRYYYDNIMINAYEKGELTPDFVFAMKLIFNRY